MTISSDFLLCHPNWTQAKQHHLDWWRNQGMVLSVTAPREVPLFQTAEPQMPSDLRCRWLDPIYKSRLAEYHISRTYFGGDAVPMAHNSLGAGDLAAILGCQWDFSETTIWFKPCIDDCQAHPAFELDTQNDSFQALLQLLQEQVRYADRRYLVAMPDLVENLDILAALRDPQTAMVDMLDRPQWVKNRISQINRVYFEVFDQFYDIIRDPDGGNCFTAFCLWGPGKTAKVQCDASAMFSPDMFLQFVVPALTEQCNWLDYAMYHLDGPQCIPHLDHLLNIESLHAIQWTPGEANEAPTHPRWHNLYHKILRSGKSLQLFIPDYHDVIALLDTIGGQGVMIITNTPSEEEAKNLVEMTKRYR